MYFKKLEIIGFKSFAEKTTLIFEPGITAIIGPNGCGKSNIFDSIRWVLGEQSVKALRGSSMEDVIFNGTETKPALNMSEVSLTFSNEAKFFPIEYDEVTITRRLFRSGESEYVLNKIVVRLKDIADLLAGTGIGAESYSLVEQGKIDLILSSRPEDRRLVFDEAAGVTKYKSKKKEALRRLEDTENNLLRVNDIILEVKRQIGSLDRQVSKARRYREEFDKLKGLEIKFAKLEIRGLKDELNNLFSKIESFKQEEAARNSELSEADSQMHGLRLKMQEAESRISQLKDDDYALGATIEKNAEFIRINTERVKELESRSENLSQQAVQIEERRSQNQDKFNNLNAEMSVISREDEDKKGQIEENNKALEALSEEIKNAHKYIAEAKKEMLALIQNETALRNDLSGINTRASAVLSRNKRLKVEREKVIQEKQSFDQEIDVIKKDTAALEEKLSGLKDEDARLKNGVRQAEDTLAQLEESTKKLEGQKLSLESQLLFLEKLKLEYEDIPELLQGRFILDNLPSNRLSGILSKVKEIKKTSSGYEVICEAKPIPLDTALIKERIEKIAADIAGLCLKIGAEKAKISQANADLEGVSVSIRREEIAFSEKRANLSSLNEQALKLTQELEIIDLEAQETDGQLHGLSRKEEEIKKELSLIEEQRRLSEAKINESTEKITLNSAKKEEINVLIARVSAELNSFQDRRLALSGSLKLIQETLENDLKTLTGAKGEIRQSGEKKEALLADSENLAKEIAESKDKKGLVLKGLDELKEDFRQLSLQEEEKEELVASLHKQISEIKDLVYKLSMQDKEAEFKETAIKERILQSYKVNLDEAPEMPEAIDREPMLAQIGEAKKKVEAFGTVNLVAIEEHEELKQRFEFLTTQQNDLVAASESLKDAVAKINKTTKQLFMDTFVKVNDEFKVYFRLLFGGGDAQLVLVDEEDVLESGIEMLVRPPGKKLQNVSLLSGGEKALTAIALIFAIFKIKPSPFCVLDEIDAALDESNVDRFNRMLQEFTKTSQFLIISHNKKTITSADVMYGITMQERGISKIVSAKLSNERKSAPLQEAVNDKIPEQV